MLEGLEVFLTSYFDAAWVLQLVIIALSWVVLCHGIHWPEGKRLRYGLQTVCLLGLLAMTDVIVMLIPNAPFPMLWNLSHGIQGAIFILLCSGYHRSAKVIVWCSMFAGVWCLTAIAGWVSYLTGAYIGKGVPEAMARCFVYLLMLPLAFFLRRFNFNDYQTVPQSGIRLILVGDASLLLLSVAEIPFIGAGAAAVVCLLIANLCMLLVMMMVVYAVHSMCRDKSEILALQTEKHRLLSERELVRLTESNLEDLRCIRHDIKNQYAYMQLLLQQKKYEELEQYFTRQVEAVCEPVAYIDCGNRIIDNVLNMELGKAKRAGISVEHQLIVPPELPFADDDVCAILANLMDNAIEECKRLQKNHNTAVSVRIAMHPHGSYLYIVCRNTTDRKKLTRLRNALQTTKGDAQLHGYGTRIVAKLAEKYNGGVDFSLKDGQFVAKVMLDMMEVGI